MRNIVRGLMMTLMMSLVGCGGGGGQDSPSGTPGATAGDKTKTEESRPRGTTYEAWLKDKDHIQSRIKATLGKTWDEFDGAAYQTFLSSLRLDEEAGVKTWSLVTGVPVIFLNEDGHFFYHNHHLLPPGTPDLANYAFNEYDASKNAIVFSNAEKKPIKDVPVKDGLLNRVVPESGNRRYYENYQGDRLDLGLLSPFLTSYDQLPRSHRVAKLLARLPFSVVKMLKGKALYFSTKEQSQTVPGAISNQLWAYFAGMLPGTILGSRQSVDYMLDDLGYFIAEIVIDNQYGGVFFPYQFPKARKLQPEFYRVFGKPYDTVDAKVPGSIHAREGTTGRVNFASHFAFYVTHPEEFRIRAEAENKDGFPQLKEKYDLLKSLIEGDLSESVPVDASNLHRFEASET